MTAKLKVNVKTALDVQDRVYSVNLEPSLTDQSFKDECDLGFIISNFVKTGKLPESTMSFVDCTTVKEYQEAMYIVAEANTNFEKLPSEMRDEFKNVEGYLAYISDKNNLRDCYERGLIDRGSVDFYDVYPEKLVQQQQIVNPLNSPVNVTDKSSQSGAVEPEG